LTEADLRLYRQAQEFLAGELSLSLGTDVEAARGKIELALGVTGEDGIESLADQL
jgi:RNA polymerase-interacting CarD/CdnL/TRCF family regulator